MGGQWFSCLTFGPLVPNNDWWYQTFIQPTSARIKCGASNPYLKQRVGKCLDYGQPGKLFYMLYRVFEFMLGAAHLSTVYKRRVCIWARLCRGLDRLGTRYY